MNEYTPEAKLNALVIDRTCVFLVSVSHCIEYFRKNKLKDKKNKLMKVWRLKLSRNVKIKGFFKSY